MDKITFAPTQKSTLSTYMPKVISFLTSAYNCAAYSIDVFQSPDGPYMLVAHFRGPIAAEAFLQDWPESKVEESVMDYYCCGYFA